MNNQIEERMSELLAGEALYSLSEDERKELQELKKKYPELAEDDSFDIAAAAFQLASIDTDDEMPVYLKNRISEQADDHWRETHGQEIDTARSVDESPRLGFMQWLGWAVAGAACLALVVNIWYSGSGPDQLAGGDRPDERPSVEKKVPTIAEKRAQLLASARVVRTKWSSPQEDLDVDGEVVWSDEKQEGYMTFRGLPVNDKSKETYQLWIFDESQDEATPIDGGVFDVSEAGEAVVPIDANLRVRGPKAFAVTVEKPGGVVVSKREKIVALANV